MRTERILLFFVTIICSSIIAGVAFAGDVKWSTGPKGASITLGADGAGYTTGHYMLAVSGAPERVSGLSDTKDLSERRYFLMDHAAEMFKVISVIEKKVADKKLRKKLEDKLPALSDNRLKLAASLSEQIAGDGHSAKKDFAFLLLTTLIVFS